MDPGDDPKVLKKRIAELERKLATAEDLIRIFKDLPFAQALERELPKSVTKPSPAPAGKKRRRRTARPEAASGSGELAADATPEPES